MSRKTEDSAVGILVGLVSLVTVPFYTGWALWTVWGWFCSDIYALGYPSAVGLALLCQLLTFRAPVKNELHAEPNSLNRLLGEQFATLVTVGVAWVLHMILGAAS